MSFKTWFARRGPFFEKDHYRGTVYQPGRYNTADVDRLHAEHIQLRWSVFSMHWSIVGWCATLDSGEIVRLLTPRPGLQRTLRRLIAA